jgi:hypothetical protein
VHSIKALSESSVILGPRVYSKRRKCCSDGGVLLEVAVCNPGAQIIPAPGPELVDHVAIKLTCNRVDEAIGCICIGRHGLKQLLARALGFEVCCIAVDWIGVERTLR